MFAVLSHTAKSIIDRHSPRLQFNERDLYSNGFLKHSCFIKIFHNRSTNVIIQDFSRFPSRYKPVKERRCAPFIKSHLPGASFQGFHSTRDVYGTRLNETLKL